jgi:hypothetical protein
MNRHNWVLILAGLAALTLGLRACFPIAAAQQPDNVQTLMRAKLQHAQGVLEGIALEDFDKIDKHAQGLALVSQAAAWQVFQTPEYVRQSAEFRRRCDALAKQARDKKLDAAALEYVNLTMQCVECHKHIRGVKVTSLGDTLERFGRLADRR